MDTREKRWLALALVAVIVVGGVVAAASLPRERDSSGDPPASTPPTGPALEEPTSNSSVAEADGAVRAAGLNLSRMSHETGARAGLVDLPEWDYFLWDADLRRERADRYIARGLPGASLRPLLYALWEDRVVLMHNERLGERELLELAASKNQSERIERLLDDLRRERRGPSDPGAEAVLHAQIPWAIAREIQDGFYYHAKLVREAADEDREETARGLVENALFAEAAVDVVAALLASLPSPATEPIDPKEPDVADLVASAVAYANAIPVNEELEGALLSAYSLATNRYPAYAQLLLDAGLPEGAMECSLEVVLYGRTHERAIRDEVEPPERLRQAAEILSRNATSADRRATSLSWAALDAVDEDPGAGVMFVESARLFPAYLALHVGDIGGAMEKAGLARPAS